MRLGKYSLIGVCMLLMQVSLTPFASVATPESVLETSGVDVSGLPGESINLFTGQLKWNVVETVLPGPAGMDLILSRTFNARSNSRWKFDIPEFDPHLKIESKEFGHRQASVINLEYTQGGLLHIPGQGEIPMMEPGSTAGPYSGWRYASPQTGWAGQVDSVNVRENGTTITYRFFSPNGHRYNITQNYVLEVLDLNKVGSGLYGIALTSQTIRQSDTFGNYIQYNQSASQITISASDGRSAIIKLQTFRDAAIGRYGSDYGPAKIYVPDYLEVTDSAGATRTWDYTYAPHKRFSFWCSSMSGDKYYRQTCSRNGFSTSYGHYRLISALRPDGTNLEYTYNIGGTEEMFGEDGRAYLRSVTLPHGSTVTYTQQTVGANNSHYNQSIFAVVKREISGDIDEVGVWEYKYDITKEVKSSRYYVPVISKKTTVTSPANILVMDFHHDFVGSASTLSNHKWGEVESSRIYDLNDIALANPLRKKDYEYSVSSTLLGSSELNSQTRRPQYLKILRHAALSKLTVDDKYITEFSEKDSFWNWKVKTETTGSRSRTTTTNFFNKLYNGTNNSFVGYVDLQTITGDGKSWVVDNTYNTSGQMVKTVDRGVENTFTYHTTSDVNDRGNLYTHTYKNQQLGTSTATYSNYKRGIAQSEVHPLGITISRQVNDSGTVAWEQDGEVNRTSFVYDDLNRVTKISPPEISATNIVYDFTTTPNTVSITREGSSYSKVIDLDALGRKILSTESGAGVDPIYVNYDYDAAGREIFVSQSSHDKEETKGIQKTYDALNRPLRVIDTATTNESYYYWDLKDGDKCSDFLYVYCFTPSESEDCSWLFPCMELSTEGFDRVNIIADAKNHYTIIKQQAFGHPDNAWNMKIEQPESITTEITRSVLGDIQSVSQGGVSRTYTYYPGTQRLKDIIEPERDKVTHTYDVAGNLRTKSIADNLLSTYDYDALNRLSKITFADDTPDVDYTYYKNNLLNTMNHGLVNRSYSYTDFSSLLNETLDVGPSGESESFTLAYGYDARGFLTSLNYPSGINLTYAVDDLGRITDVTAPNKNLVNNVTYHPNSTIHEMTYGNNIKTTYDLDSRQMVEKITAQKGIENRFKMGFTYDAVTNVSSITDYLDSINDITMTYDGVNRLKTATGLKWGNASFGYDTKGNITSKNMGSLGSLSYTYNPDTNQLDSVSGIESRAFNYDQFGNATSNGNHNFTYNSASRMTQVVDPVTDQPLIEYTYDGNGIKVVDFKPDVEALYTFYSQAGDLLYEKDFISGVESSYIQLGNQNIAKINTGCIGTDTDKDGIEDCIETKLGLDPFNPADASQDRDGDGLTNAQEIALGTNIDNADSDGDGMPDKWEVDMGLNPLADDAGLDTDGDGYTNLQEYQNGTSPLEAFNFSYVLPAILHIILN